MPRRTLMIIGVVFLFVVFANIFGGKEESPPAATEVSRPTVSEPLPAASPTATPDERSSTPRKEKRPSKHKPAKDDFELSDISPGLRSKLERVVKLYASWPGATPKRILLRELRQEQPFITAGAIEKIERGWSDTPQTFKVTVKHVNLEPGFTASPDDSSAATVVAYVTVEKKFTPVSGRPYFRMTNLPYTVSMRVIKRKWRVTGITTQVSPASAEGQP